MEVIEDLIQEGEDEWGSPVHHMIAGSVAGVAEHCAVFPLDTIKVWRIWEVCNEIKRSLRSILHTKMLWDGSCDEVTAERQMWRMLDLNCECMPRKGGGAGLQRRVTAALECVDIATPISITLLFLVSIIQLYLSPDPFTVCRDEARCLCTTHSETVSSEWRVQESIPRHSCHRAGCWYVYIGCFKCRKRGE